MEENNKIIAEFMEIAFNVNEFQVDFNSSLYSKLLVSNMRYWDERDENFEINPYSFLYFDTDWNWLMEVVEKIESIKDSYHGRFGVYISSNSCTIQSTNFRPDKPIPNPPHYYDNVVLNTKIESTYYSVLNFINFYNKQKEE